jgi:hypothetical protein
MAKAKKEVDLAAQEEIAVANERKIEFAIEEDNIELQETDLSPIVAPPIELEFPTIIQPPK